MSSELLSQTLQHLSQAARIVDGDNRTNKLLNCYYLSRIQCLATTGNVSIETSSNPSCAKCNTPFRDSTNFTLSIKPRKIRNGKYKKLVTNSDGNSRNDNKFKRKLGQKYRRLVYNVAESTCKLCNSKSKSSIRFDSKDKSKPKLVDHSIVQLSALELVNPKMRKRDKNAGLILKDSVTTSFISSKTKIVQPIKVAAAATSKSNKVKKSKNSTATEKKTNKISAAQKQRKGMLLLANVLKMNDQKPQNSSQSMLSKMFK